MYAKKSLGQHFLKSEKALSSIIRAGEIKNTDTILEIGPGKGALTEKLLETGSKVIAVEKDDQLYEFLKQKFPVKNIELIHADILDIDPPQDKWKLIANIPYNLTGAILKKFLEARNPPEKMVLLVQKEVAERIVGLPRRGGARIKESILSISVKAYGTPKYIEKVLAGSFVPIPKVDSAIIVIDNISKKLFNTFSEKMFFKVVKTGFSSKRKKLSSNLSGTFDKNLVQKAFQELNLDPNLRAEDVNLEIWSKIVDKIR